MSTLRWFVSVLTFVCALAAVLLCLVGLVTTQWYVGHNNFCAGLASDCAAEATTVYGWRITYCTRFSPYDLANNWEAALAGTLLGCLGLGVCACAVLCYACCAHTTGAVRLLLTLQALGVAGVCVGYAVYQQDRLPDDVHLGYSYAAVMAASGLAMCGAVLSSCAFDVPRYREYIPLI